MKTSQLTTLFRKGRAVLDVVSQTVSSLRYSPATLKDNFRRHGPEFNATNFQDFESMARHFFREAKHGRSTDYTTVRLPGNRVAIDFRGEKRGIFLKDGTPVAFFRPDYREQGYQSKEEEMRDWQSGKVAEYLA